MLSIENLSFKKKLVVLLVMPLLVILFFSSTAIYNKVNTKTEMNKIDQLVILSSHISSLVHELQKERGATAVFIRASAYKLAAKFAILVSLCEFYNDIKFDRCFFFT